MTKVSHPSRTFELFHVLHAIRDDVLFEARKGKVLPPGSRQLRQRARPVGARWAP